MKTFHLRRSYTKDLKRLTKRKYDLTLLAHILNALRENRELPPACRDHALKGEWEGWRECHVQSNWLLIYRTTDTEVLLARTGTHADLFSN
jgi:mRNA interferase YafQ